MMTCYKEWLINELLGITEIFAVNEIATDPVSMDTFDAFELSNESTPERELEAVKDQRHFIEAVSVFLVDLSN